MLTVTLDIYTRAEAIQRTGAKSHVHSESLQEALAELTDENDNIPAVLDDEGVLWVPSEHLVPDEGSHLDR